MTLPIKAGILTASDRSAQGTRADESGTILKALVESLSIEVAAYQIRPDDVLLLQSALCQMADETQCQLILTTGGTGLSPRDNTPEATRAVIDKEIPGIAEAIREASLRKTPFAMLSRGVAGIRGKSLIINLPGSPKAVAEIFEVLRPVLRHAVELIQGEVSDCQKTPA